MVLEEIGSYAIVSLGLGFATCWYLKKTSVYSFRQNVNWALDTSSLVLRCSAGWVYREVATLSFLSNPKNKIIQTQVAYDWPTGLIATNIQLLFTQPGYIDTTERATLMHEQSKKFGEPDPIQLSYTESLRFNLNESLRDEDHDTSIICCYYDHEGKKRKKLYSHENTVPIGMVPPRPKPSMAAPLLRATITIATTNQTNINGDGDDNGDEEIQGGPGTESHSRGGSDSDSDSDYDPGDETMSDSGSDLDGDEYDVWWDSEADLEGYDSDEMDMGIIEEEVDTFPPQFTGIPSVGDGTSLFSQVFRLCSEITNTCREITDSTYNQDRSLALIRGSIVASVESIECILSRQAFQGPETETLKKLTHSIRYLMGPSPRQPDNIVVNPNFRSSRNGARKGDKMDSFDITTVGDMWLSKRNTSAIHKLLPYIIQDAAFSDNCVFTVLSQQEKYIRSVKVEFVYMDLTTDVGTIF